MTFTCGIDWAERHHDVALVDSDGATIAKKRIDTGVAGLADLLALIAEHGGDPDTVPVAIETDKNLIVVALTAAGFTVYPINPRAVARYRERHGQAGGKSDPGDAIVLAHILRTDREHHRPLPVSSDSALAIKALARQHQEAIWARQHTVNRLRSILIEYYPNALKAFPSLTMRSALTILAAAPSPARADQLTVSRIAALLRKSGRGNRAGLAEKILADLTADALRQAPPVEHALGQVAAGLVSIISTMETVIANLEDAMAVEFDRHQHANLIRSAPGLGPILAARVLAEIGDDPNRFTLPPVCARLPAPHPSHAHRGGPRSSPPDASATADLQTPAIGGRSLPSQSHQAPEPTTTVGELPVTPTTPHSATSPTSSSGGSGGASTTTKPGTTTLHGPTPHHPQPKSPLDTQPT